MRMAITASSLFKSGVKDSRFETLMLSFLESGVPIRMRRMWFTHYNFSVSWRMAHMAL